MIIEVPATGVGVICEFMLTLLQPCAYCRSCTLRAKFTLGFSILYFKVAFEGVVIKMWICIFVLTSGRLFVILPCPSPSPLLTVLV